MAKENKPAQVYARQGMKSVLKNQSGKEYMNTMNPSVGSISDGNEKTIKTSGIKIRGTGAATKGVMARGPMG
jgi:hypothetical protein